MDNTRIECSRNGPVWAELGHIGVQPRYAAEEAVRLAAEALVHRPYLVRVSPITSCAAWREASFAERVGPWGAHRGLPPHVTRLLKDCAQQAASACSRNINRMPGSLWQEGNVRVLREHCTPVEGLMHVSRELSEESGFVTWSADKTSDWLTIGLEDGHAKVLGYAPGCRDMADALNLISTRRGASGEKP